MKYYVIISGDYILGIYTGKKGKNPISKDMYQKIFSIIQHAPVPEEGKGYRLRTDLTWEEYDLPEEEEETEE